MAEDLTYNAAGHRGLITVFGGTGFLGRRIVQATARFVADSPLEGAGFEPSVPPSKGTPVRPVKRKRRRVQTRRRGRGLAHRETAEPSHALLRARGTWHPRCIELRHRLDSS